MLVYVFHTWVIAGFVCPFIIGVWPLLYGGISSDASADLVMYFFLAIFYSIPWVIFCTVLGRFFISAVINARLKCPARFLLWLALVAMVVVTNGVLLGIILTSEWPDHLPLLICQMVIAAWITEVIRYQTFKKLIKLNTVHYTNNQNLPL